MTSFLIILGIIVLIVFLLKPKKNHINSNKQTSNYKDIQSRTDSKQKRQIINKGILYKSRGIKTFEMKGMYYLDLNPNIHGKEFIGYAICEDNEHDKYAVEIYNNNNELLGYTPKGNKRLNNSLLEWNNGKVLAWGGLSFENYNDKWYGTVFIPVGFTSEQIEKLNIIIKLRNKNKENIKKKDKSTEMYFEILNNHKIIKQHLFDLNNPEEIYYSFPKNFIPSISSHLEKEKNWSRLIQLEDFPDLISNLSKKYKETTLKRIDKAKKNIS